MGRGCGRRRRSIINNVIFGCVGILVLKIFVDFLYIFAYNRVVGSVMRQAICVCFFATCAAGGDAHGKNH